MRGYVRSRSPLGMTANDHAVDGPGQDRRALTSLGTVSETGRGGDRGVLRADGSMLRSPRALAVFFASIAWICLLPNPARADVEADAIALVEHVHETALQLSQIGVAETGSSAYRVIRAAFDGSTIGRVVLGQYWASASADERARFVDALLHAIARGLAERLTGTSRQAFNVLGTEVLPNGDVLVKSRFERTIREPVNLYWRVHQCETGQCIRDVIVDGASVALQQRDDVTARMAASGGSMEKLIADLREVDEPGSRD